MLAEIPDAYIYILAGMAFATSFANLIYFIVVPTIYRYIKLMYAIDTFIVGAALTYYTVTNIRPHPAIHFATIALLIITICSGTIVSFAKLTSVSYPIIERLKGALWKQTS